jgi:hypothetical protein
MLEILRSWQWLFFFGILILVTAPGYLSYIHGLTLAPPNTSLSLSFSHQGDYYQLLHYIYSGMHGYLLYDVPYIELAVQPMILVPIYFVAGWLFSPVIHSHIAIMLLLRIVTTVCYFFCFLFLVKKLFSSFIFRFMSVILMVSFTSFWTKSADAYGAIFLLPILGRDGFSVFSKFQLPPHHYVAIIAMMVSLFLLAEKPWTKKRMLLLVITTCTVGFMYTYHLTLLVVIAGSNGILEGITTRNWKKGIYIMLPVLIPATVIYAYYSSITAAAFPWTKVSILSLFLIQIHPNEIKLYILALGPIFILSSLFLIPLFSKKTNRLLQLLFLWAILPLFEIIFPNTLEFLRPYNTHQYIPLSLLTTAGFSHLVSKHKFFLTLAPVIIIASILYAVPPYIAVFQRKEAVDPTIDFQTYIPNNLLKTFSYMEKNILTHTYVLAGPNVGMMIPAFTQDRVIVGQSDSIEYYVERKNAVQMVFYYYSMGMDSVGLKQFLQKYHISYILFGTDAPSYRGNETIYPFLKETHREGGISLVKVL